MSRWLPTGASMGCRRGRSSSGSSSSMTPTGGGWTPTVIRHNRLEYALQLGTVRFLGTFLGDPLDVPWAVVEYLADQLGVPDASVVKDYAERIKRPMSTVGRSRRPTRIASWRPSR